MLLSEPISVITSWEDYEYQGHVCSHFGRMKMIIEISVGMKIYQKH